jgi:selenocysteine-specific elongation factor
VPKIHTIVLGTAGHIDHGKSTLVEKLTGVNPDRLPEEKERGMTIDLGFAPLALSDGTRVGIVDVPGHERFIKNMVAGATGIDVVLLVVAADDGVMPQTREHLEIMELLGLERGMVAITKVDLVERDLLELVLEDVRALVAGTFLEGAPLLPISSTTGEGWTPFREALERLLRETPPRSSEGVFRMPIQRVFSARGYGTVVTGIPVSGKVRLGDRVEILPIGKSGRIRGIQAYRETVEEARAGHSTALNLSDVDYREVRRGMTAAVPGFFKPATMVEAKFRYLRRNRRPHLDRTELRFHAGTGETIGVAVLLDHAALQPGEEGFVQFRLEEPVVVVPGDRYIARLASPLVTVGGGVVLAESERRLKRFKGFVLEDLARKEATLEDVRGRLEQTLRGAGIRPQRADALARQAVMPLPEASAALAAFATEGKARRLRGDLWIHVEGWAEAAAKANAAIDAAFERAPHRSLVEHLAVREGSKLEPDVLDAVLEELSAKGEISLDRRARVRRKNRAPRLSAEAARVRGPSLGALREGHFSPPTVEDLAARLRASVPALREALESLADEGEAAAVSPELFFSAAAIAAVKREVAANVAAHGELDIPALRDRLGTTRKYLIPLLEHLDDEGFTIRQGARRILRPGGEGTEVPGPRSEGGGKG